MADTKASNSVRDSGLIASDEIEATPVRRSSGEMVGAIKKLMIDMRNGEITHVVLSFGGFLGVGEEQRALPWRMLKYNETLEAFELDITTEQLREMPTAPDRKTIGDRAGELIRHTNIGAQRRSDDEGGEETTPPVSETEIELNTLLERLDKKIAAEHLAMDRLLERIAIGAAQ